jgi:hypothetical protein
MNSETKERWMEFAALAATEKDPEKLIELVSKINELLAEKYPLLAKKKPMSASNTSLKTGAR